MTQYSGEYRAQELDPAQFWERKTWQVRLLVNFAWWLESLLPIGFVVALALSVFILAGRRGGWPSAALETAAVVSALAAVGASYLRARRHFVSQAQARAQIDGALALHTRLTAAAEGVGGWPDPALWRGGNWQWNIRRLAGGPATCAALIAAAFVVPIPGRVLSLPPPTAKPPALAQVEELLQKLAETPALDPASLDPVREQAEQLAKQQAGDWYSQSSLEAADHLAEQLQAGLRAMDQNATKIESILGAAANAELSDALANRLSASLSEALGALQGNVPGLNKSLAAKLGQLDPSKLRTLSPEQVSQLKKELGQCNGACRKGLAKGPADGEGDPKEASDDEQGPRTGEKGGVGPTPLTLNHKPAEVGEKKEQGVENNDFSHTALGEQIGESSGQHEVDRQTDHRAADGGSVGSEGAGAGAVWIQQNLTPQERRQVQQFFK